MSNITKRNGGKPAEPKETKKPEASSEETKDITPEGGESTETADTNAENDEGAETKTETEAPEAKEAKTVKVQVKEIATTYNQKKKIDRLNLIRTQFYNALHWIGETEEGKPFASKALASAADSMDAAINSAAVHVITKTK